MSVRVPVLTIVLCLPWSWQTLAMTDQDCQAHWVEADANGDGSLTAGEADRYLGAMRLVGQPAPAEGNITAPVFLERCRDDAFTTATVDPSAPFAGANSFTEGQAQDRIIAAGLTGVSSLRKDGGGIWRGTATRNGRSVNVAVDYKGNVVVN